MTGQSLGFEATLAALPICCLDLPLLVATLGALSAALIGGPLVACVAFAAIFLLAAQRKRLQRGKPL